MHFKIRLMVWLVRNVWLLVLKMKKVFFLIPKLSRYVLTVQPAC